LNPQGRWMITGPGRALARFVSLGPHVRDRAVAERAPSIDPRSFHSIRKSGDHQIRFFARRLSARASAPEYGGRPARYLFPAFLSKKHVRASMGGTISRPSSNQQGIVAFFFHFASPLGISTRRQSSGHQKAAVTTKGHVRHSFSPAFRLRLAVNARDNRTE